MKKNISFFRIIILFLSLLVAGCTLQVRSNFNEFAFQQTTALKVDTIFLLDKANEPYQNHVEEINELKRNLLKAYEYAKGREDNDIIVKMWQIFIDPKRHLVGRFLKRWEEKKTLSDLFIEESKKSIIEAFDLIIGIEGGKIDFDKGNLPSF